MTATMRAARFDAASRQLTVTDVPLPVPVPGPTEVLVRVEACGICLSDVHLLDGSLPGPLGQSLLGHLGDAKHHPDELVALVASGRLGVSRSISDVLPLDDVGRGVERLVTKDGDPVRRVVQPWT